MSDQRGPASPRCRRFTVADALLMVIAVMVAVFKALHDFRWELDEELAFGGEEYFDQVASPFAFLGKLPEALLVAGSCAWLVMRFSGPRPSLRRVLAQPGATAVLAAVGFLALVRLEWLILIPLRIATKIPANPASYWPINSPWELLSVDTPEGNLEERGIGLVVVAAWVTMALGRRCRSETGWIDATGISLGIGWIAYLVSYTFGLRQ